MSESTEQEFAVRIQGLRRRFAEGLPERLAEVRRGWDKFCTGATGLGESQELILAVHKLAGAGATFGFPNISRFARILEGLIEVLAHREREPNAIQIAQGESLLKELAEAALARPTRAGQISIGDPTEELPQSIYVADSDDAAAVELIEQLENFGYRCERMRDVESLAAAMERETPLAALIGLDFGGEPLGGVFAAIGINAATETKLPWIFLSRRDDLEARLKAIHAGSQAYFLKPLHMPDLLQHIEDRSLTRQTDPYRVLIVEDDPAMAQYAALCLEHGDIATRQIEEPTTFLDVVSDFKPELVLMDLYVGNMLGTELAQVLEQHDGYQNLPVIFLSSEPDDHIRFDALEKGGDNFLQKPIQAKHLFQAVRSRVRRARQVASLVHRDGLTGLLNHRAIMGRVSVIVKRAIRARHQISLAMLDIDHFKRVNDTYGHSVGDRVLQGLGRMLQQRVRESDLVGRYGGEEFLILFPDTEPKDAANVLDEIREHFSRVKHLSTTGEEFQMTFSAGVSSLPPHSDQETLFVQADEALYRAKKAGRNRVLLDSPA